MADRRLDPRTRILFVCFVAAAIVIVAIGRIVAASYDAAPAAGVPGLPPRPRLRRSPSPRPQPQPMLSPQPPYRPKIRTGPDTDPRPDRP